MLYSVNRSTAPNIVHKPLVLYTFPVGSTTLALRVARGEGGVGRGDNELWRVVVVV